MIFISRACLEVWYLKVSIFQLSAMQGVVYICTSWRIHAAHRQIPQVLPLRHVLYHTSTFIHCLHTDLYILYVRSNYRLIGLTDKYLTKLGSEFLSGYHVTSGVMAHGILGRKLSTAWEKAWWGTSCSSSSTSCSVSLSPALPRLRTKWPWQRGNNIYLHGKNFMSRFCVFNHIVVASCEQYNMSISNSCQTLETNHSQISKKFWRDFNSHLDIWSLWASHRWKPWSCGPPVWTPDVFQCEYVGCGGLPGWRGDGLTVWKRKEKVSAVGKRHGSPGPLVHFTMFTSSNGNLLSRYANYMTLIHVFIYYVPHLTDRHQNNRDTGLLRKEGQKWVTHTNQGQPQIFKQAKTNLFNMGDIEHAQNGLQFLLMMPTTFPVGFLAASATDILNCSDTWKHERH